MLRLTARQTLSVLIGLSAFHMFIIILSNYLVQLPVQVFRFHTTWGAFTFPFIFLATDLTVRIFGGKWARKIIFLAMLPALIASYIISSLFFEGHWQGFSALFAFNTMVIRIAIASFSAYVLGQILDIFVFSRLRQLKTWWIAPSASALFGNMIDTLAFFSIAFYKGSDAFLATHWVEIGTVDYIFKLLICIVFFVPAYGMLLNTLIKKILFKQTKEAVIVV